MLLLIGNWADWMRWVYHTAFLHQPQGKKQECTSVVIEKNLENRLQVRLSAQSKFTGGEHGDET